MTTETQTKKITMAEAITMINELNDRIAILESKIQPQRNEAQREMTDDDAKRILTGDLAAKKHKDAASELGLSYGQIYSCRLEFTFKHVHKAMKEANTPNPWAK